MVKHYYLSLTILSLTILLLILLAVTISVNNVYAEQETPVNLCELYNIDNTNIYEISISVKHDSKESIYRSKEDISAIMNLLDAYYFDTIKSEQGFPWSLSLEYIYGATLSIKLNDKDKTIIYVYDSGYVYSIKEYERPISSPGFIQAVACDERQLAGLIYNLYSANAEAVQKNVLKKRGNLYLGKKSIDLKDTVYFDRQSVIIPMRGALEALGFTVQWNAAEESVRLAYEDHAYLCQITSPNTCLPQRKGIVIYDESNILAIRGQYIEINDRIYLNAITLESLLKPLGYKININWELNTVKIY